MEHIPLYNLIQNCAIYRQFIRILIKNPKTKKTAKLKGSNKVNIYLSFRYKCSDQ